MEEFLLTLSCPDQPGIVRALSNAIFELGGNITENAEFTEDNEIFCARTQFVVDAADAPDAEAVAAALRKALHGMGASVAVRPRAARKRVLIAVSKFDHCLVDLLYRWRIGELPVEIVAVVSNHPDCAELVDQAGIQFVHLPVTADNKPHVEGEWRRLILELDANFVVLARYMQILSDEFSAEFAGRIINIHHSFLPGFKGAKPYHQAFARGVKLIGATAHYVTVDLDEGPIIEQDMERISHSHTADELVAIGRDIERRVLSRAVKLHAEDRVILTGNRTVVFS